MACPSAAPSVRLDLVVDTAPAAAGPYYRGMAAPARTWSLATATVTAMSLAVAGAGPASAASSALADAEPMSPGEAILIFGGIPLVVIALVYLLVSAPSWTRSGRSTSVDAWTGDPVVVDSHGVDSAADEAHEAITTDDTGGTSARW
jgi:hypothetical protein